MNDILFNLLTLALNKKNKHFQYNQYSPTAPQTTASKLNKSLSQHILKTD